MENLPVEHPFESEATKHLATEAFELVLDQFIKEGILKDIPILSSILSGIKVIKGTREALYIKKFFRFLSSAEDISEEEREKFFFDLSRDQENKDRLFEKILLTLEKLDEIKKADYLGKALLLLLKRDITFPEFHRVSKSINDVNLDDLHVLFEETRYILLPSDSMLAKTMKGLLHSEKLETAQALLRSGILMERPELKARGFGQERKGMPARGENYEDEMEMRIVLSRVGEILIKISTIVKA